jgi:sarcosine oxidase subunit beta
MEKIADIVIIGGGIIGLSIAYQLSLRKPGKIILLEKEQLGGGSTGRCIGGIRVQFSTEINILFSLESIKFFEAFKDEFGIDPGFKKIGYLFLATNESEIKLFRENIRIQKSFNLPVTFLNQEEIVKQWPFLRSEDILGATFCPIDGFADPSAILSGLIKGARRNGVKIYEGSEVIKILIYEGIVKGVKTTKEKILTPIVVNAGGPYAQIIAEMAGINLPVKPLRRQIFVTAPIHLTDHEIPLIIDFTRGWYFRKEGIGFLLSGPLDKEPSFNLNIDYEAMAETAENAIYRVPAFEKAKLIRGWAGLYELSPDHHAILGRVPGLEGFILANGLSGHGFQHSPAIGKVLAELILEGNAKTIDISSLSIERFQKGKAILELMTAFKD